MAEITRVTFDYQEIVTALLKKEGIHKGIWMLYLEFGLAAVNAPIQEGGQEVDEKNPLEHIMPTAILPVKKIGIQRTDQLSNIAVDAAVVNPRTKSPSQKGGRKR